jgi:hypothetical protein
MFSLVPLPYRVLAVVLLSLALVGGGFAAGHRAATNAAEADRADALALHIKALDAERLRADAATARIAAAEGRIVIKTVEVIRNVPSVTTGRKCLDPAAVRLLQPATDTASKPPAGKPVAESPADLAASDTDVAYWIAEANRHYETCAGRLNGLVDWHAEDVTE